MNNPFYTELKSEKWLFFYSQFSAFLPLHVYSLDRAKQDSRHFRFFWENQWPNFNSENGILPCSTPSIIWDYLILQTTGPLIRPKINSFIYLLLSLYLFSVSLLELARNLRSLIRNRKIKTLIISMYLHNNRFLFYHVNFTITFFIPHA